MVVTVVQGDTKQIIRDILKVDGAPVDLSNSTVEFIMRAVGGVAIVRTATITQTAPPPDPSAGRVEYQLVDTDVAGEYRQRWKVVWQSDSKPLSFPNDGDNKIIILPKLD